MTLSAALHWLHSLPIDSAARWSPLDAATTWADLAAAAGADGYPCSEAELQIAFREDWAMRWLRYAPPTQADESV